MTPSDSDKQSQPVSPPPVLPASWHAEQSLETEKTTPEPQGIPSLHLPTLPAARPPFSHVSPQMSASVAGLSQRK